MTVPMPVAHPFGLASDTTDVADVAVARNGEVHVLTRYPSRVEVFDTEGAALGIYADGDVLSTRPHGISIDGNADIAYITDESADAVIAFGLTNGNRPVPGGRVTTAVTTAVTTVVDASSGLLGRPTKAIADAAGALFVADGYGNSHVHRIAGSPDRTVTTWGTPGSGCGQFDIPHSLMLTADGRLLVADRENDRIQVFDTDGRWLDEWTDIQRPTAIAQAADGTIWIAEFPIVVFDGPNLPPQPVAGTRAAAITALDPTGRMLSRCHRLRTAGGVVTMRAPHGLAITHDGRLCVAEVNRSMLRSATLPAFHVGAPVP